MRGGQSLSGAHRSASDAQTVGLVTVQFTTTEAARLAFPGGRISTSCATRF